MLTLFNVLIHGFLVFILLPIVLISLATGSKQPEHSPLAKFYRAEPWLGLVGNIFLLMLCAIAATKLALHFGFIDATLAETIDNSINFPFIGMLLVMIFMWVRAVLRVRRESRHTA